MKHRRRRGGDRDYDELNRGDYRADFGPEGYDRFDSPTRDRRNAHRESYGRAVPAAQGAGLDPAEHRGQRTAGRWRWTRGAREGWQRGRVTGGYGSQFDAWSSGAGFRPAGFGFGPEEEPTQGGFADEDWQPTRPARGRGTWVGDWSDESYRGRGPRGYRRSDDRVRDEVCERLTDDSSVDASDISVDVNDGDVTLTGTVASRQQKRSAADCIDRVPGVRDVFNRLRVATRDLESRHPWEAGRR
jgi:hypothetical protein